MGNPSLSDTRGTTSERIAEGVQKRGPVCHSHGTTGAGLWVTGGVAFVGIAPGADEVIKGTPFTGPSGQLLNSVLDACEWPRDRVYTTNLLCWWNNAPDLVEIMRCWPRLHAELQDLQPKLIIPLGEIATDFLLGNYAGNIDFTPSEWSKYAKENYTKWPRGEQYYGFGNRRGRTTWSSALGAYVMPTYHPSAVLRGGHYFISDIVRDLAKIPLVLKEFKDGGRESEYNYTTVTSVESGQRLLDNLPKGITADCAGVALDIETNYGREDIDIFSEDLLCLSLTWGWNTTAVIPGEIAKRLDWSVTADVHWIGQNFIFDSGGMKRWCGADLPIIEDTMYESYALDERPGHHGLEVIGGEWCAAPTWKSDLAQYEVKKPVLNTKTGRTVQRTFREVPDSALYEYNAGDTTYTYRGHVRQLRQVHAEGMDRMYRQLLVPAANAFKDIQYRGLYIDQIRQSQLMVEWCEMWLDQEKALQEMAHEADPTLRPDQNLNFGSPKQMATFLYETLGLPPQYTKSTKKAEAPRVTTNKDALEVLYQYHAFPQLLHDARQTKHMLEVSEGITSRLKVDGFLHAQPQIHGTETGRLSYHDPNIQNLSQYWTVGYNLARIREIFAPENPDTHFLAEADYKQVELFMAERWSGDKNMRADLATGDFHRMTAAGIYHKAPEDVTAAERFQSKMVSFGRLYERGAVDLTKGRSGLHCSVAEAEVFIRQWSSRYSGYVDWATALKQQAINDGIIETPWGRKRRYYLVMGEEAHHMLRSALNFMMQSTAHDYTLSALIILAARMREFNSYILIENHDAILFEIDKRYAKPCMQLITETMQGVRPNSDWPFLEVEWKTGPNWGQCKEACKTCHRLYPEVKVEEYKVSETRTVLRCTDCQREVRLAA